MKIRTVVGAHLFRERFDVMIAVVAPLIIMLESGYGNAWAFAGGAMGLNIPTAIALARGIFLEGLVFAMFKIVKLLVGHKTWSSGFLALVPAAIGVVGMVVSAGCNLGFVNHDGNMLWVLKTVQTFLPVFLVEVFKLGLGLLFPIAVGAYALFDLKHLVMEAMRASELDNMAMIVDKAEQGRTMFLKQQRRSIKGLAQDFEQICAADAQNMIKAVKNGDLSFGVKDLFKHVEPALKASVTPLRPQQQSPSLPPAYQPNLLQQGRPAAAPFNGQFPGQHQAPIQPQPTIIDMTNQFPGQAAPSPVRNYGYGQPSK